MEKIISFLDKKKVNILLVLLKFQKKINISV